jgi:hypothetical protein
MIGFFQNYHFISIGTNTIKRTFLVVHRLISGSVFLVWNISEGDLTLKYSPESVKNVFLVNQIKDEASCLYDRIWDSTQESHIVAEHNLWPGRYRLLIYHTGDDRALLKNIISHIQLPSGINVRIFLRIGCNSGICRLLLSHNPQDV